MFRFLLNVREYVERGMLDPQVVLKDGGTIEYARAVGMRDGIDMVLGLEIEDLIEVDDDNREGLDPCGLSGDGEAQED